MFIKGVKPRTHLKVDALLFIFLVSVALSIFLEHTILQDERHLRFMMHVLHSVSGIAMCLLVCLHLFLHLPWIRSQLSRLFKSQG